MATTRDYTDYLNDQVDIAPVNSQEELQASEIVESLFVQHGLETHVEEFDAPILANLSTRIYMIILFLGILLSGFLGTPVSVVGLVLVAVSFVLLALARNDNDVLAAIGPQARSQNVVGVHRATGPNVIKGNRPIVIVAHYDTPRENFLYNKQFAKWQPIIKRLAWPLSIAVLVLTLMQVVPFLPVIVRRVFWVLGVLAALPLLLLGASSVYERFAPCTTGANDNKASMAALLGVLDMVRPGPDDAKRWAATHPKSVRRSLEEELEDEIYGDEWDEDEEYADEDTFADDAEDYVDDDRYRYEDEVEEGGYVDEELDGEDVFEDEEAYDDESFVDESAISEEDEYAGYEDEEPLADDETDEEYLDDEYFEDEEVEEPSTSAHRVYRPAAVGTGFVDEYGLETPATVRRGASVLESLQVLPETCEIVYENLIPRDEAIDRIEGVAEQADEIVEVADKSSEALDRIKSVAGSAGKAILGALFAARDWAQRVFDHIGELFVSIKERFGKDHNLPEIDKAGEVSTTSAAYDEEAEDYVEEYLDEDTVIEDDYLESDIDNDYLETEDAEDYLEDAADEEYLDDASDEDYLENVDGKEYPEDELDEDYFEEDEYLEDEEPYDTGVIEERIDEVEESDFESAPIIEPIPMPAFSNYDAIAEEYVQERAADTPSDSVDMPLTEEEMGEPTDSDDKESSVGDLVAEPFQEEVAEEDSFREEVAEAAPFREEIVEADSFQEEVAEEFAQPKSNVFDVYVPEDKYRRDAIFDTADIPLASFELIDEEEGEVQNEAVAQEFVDENVAGIYDEQEIPELETEYVDESGFSAESTGQLPRVNAAAVEVAEEDEEIDAIADAEAAVASLWVPSEPIAETDTDSTEMDFAPLDEPADVVIPELEPIEAPSAFDVPTMAPIDEAVEEEFEELNSEMDDFAAAPASMYDSPETSMVEMTLDELEDAEPAVEQPVDVPTSASYIYDEEPLVATAPEVTEDPAIRSSSYAEIGDTQSNEVIDADPWGPYLDVMDAEYELLDDEPEDLENDSVPVEVVDVPSMGLGYEIPGLTPTDELFAHEETVVAPAGEWDTASIPSTEDIENVVEDVHQSVDSLSNRPEDTYEPVAEDASTRLWTPAPEERLEEAAIDEIFESVVKEAAEQSDSVVPVVESVAAAQVTTNPEEDASSILHAMFASAPEQERIEMPRTSDVLHEMFATRPHIEPEQPVVAEEPIELDEPMDEYDQVPEIQSGIDEYPLPSHDAETEKEPVAEEAVTSAVEEALTEVAAETPAVEEIEELEPEHLDEQPTEPEPSAMEVADTFESVDEPGGEFFESVEGGLSEVAREWDAGLEQQDEGEAVDIQPEATVEFEEDNIETEIDEEPFDFVSEPQIADDLESEVDLEENFGQTIDAVDDVEPDSLQAEATVSEAEPEDDFVPDIVSDEVVEEDQTPTDAVESINEHEELPIEEVVEDLVEDEEEPLVAEEPEGAEAASEGIEPESEFAEAFAQEGIEPVDTEEVVEELDEAVPAVPLVEEEDAIEQKADPYATQLMNGLVFSNEEDVSEEELAGKDVTGLTMISEEAEADVEAYLPAEDDRIPKPRAVDDPDWGKTNFKPATVSVGRRAMLLDLPDPSVMAVDPLDAGQSGTIARGSVTASRTQGAASVGRNVEAQRRLDALRRVPSPLDEPISVPAAPKPEVEQPAAKPAAEEPELPKYNNRKNIESRTPKKNAKRKMRFGLRRKNAPEQVESMGEWLGLDDDYDAKKDGRQIGSWDNFDDDNTKGKWKGGATYRAGLRDEYNDDTDVMLDDSRYDEYGMAPDYAAEDGSMMDEAEQNTLDDESMTELREAVLRLGDDDIIAHDVWFVGVGASTLDHAGMRAFLDEHRRDIRGAFLVNIDSVGAGDLKVLTSEGMGNKRRSDRRMVRMFSNIAEALHIDLGRADYSWEETDATPAMQRSVRVNTLMGMSNDGVAAHSHTSNDEPEYLDDQQIANVADLIAELIRRS